MLRNLFLIVPFLLLVNMPVALHAKDVQTCVSCHSEVNEISVLHRKYLNKNTYVGDYRACVQCHSDFNSVFTLHREYIGLD
jgi:hypothetical protein